MPFRLFLTLIGLTSLVAGCTSTPVAQAPSWIHDPTRRVDAGYIVYVGVSEDPTSERADFKAESQAMEDVGNECSFVPKGARVEDRYHESLDGGRVRAYAKIGLTFEECEEAKNTIDPEAVKKLANLAMAEQLRRYQDLIGETQPTAADMEPTGEVVAEETKTPPRENPPYRTAGGFFIARQQVFWAKQTVILAPVGVYAPSAPATTQYLQQVQQPSHQILAYERANPAVRATGQGWSSVNSVRPSPVIHQNNLRGSRPEPAPPRPRSRRRRRR